MQRGVLEAPTITGDHRNDLGAQLDGVDRPAGVAEVRLARAVDLAITFGTAQEQSHVGRMTRVEEEQAPLVTMEAVRVALRRLDYGDDAMCSPAISKIADHPGPPPPEKKTVKYWSSGGPHYASSNKKCAAALRLKRQAQGAGRGRGRRGRGTRDTGRRGQCRPTQA